MTSYVMLHGGGMGGWVWRYIAGPLRNAGHQVFTPTFTGFGDRRHLTSRQIDDRIHVADIANLIACEEVEDVVLVAHSYGGAIAPGVCAAAAGLIASVVMIDAVILERGESVAETMGYLTPAQAAEMRALHARGEGPIGAGLPDQVRAMARIEPQLMSAERDAWFFRHLSDMPFSANLAQVAVGASAITVPVDYLTVPHTMMQPMHARAAALGWRLHALGGARDHMVHVGDPESVLAHLTR